MKEKWNVSVRASTLWSGEILRVLHTRNAGVQGLGALAQPPVVLPYDLAGDEYPPLLIPL